MNGNRILIKVSGEALNGGGPSIYNKVAIDNFCCEIKKATEVGYEIEIVVGAGNLIRVIK